MKAELFYTIREVKTLPRFCALEQSMQSVLSWKHKICSVAVLASVAMPSFAAMRPQKQNHKIPLQIEQEFPTDPFVRRQVRFWEAIFQKYKSNSVVIHDVDDPLAMIDVIDFDHYISSDGKVTSIEDSNQTNLVKKYIDRYNVAVERFSKMQESAVKFGPIEQRLFEVYNREPQTLARLYAGNVRFRGQGGLADTFLAAANRAQEFMPYMEETFKRYGLPIKLTRLPFVESMFNLNAKSKVGASGIWQFMPDTGREYMYVGQMVDERNNPFKATHAAAQLFLTNYKELGAWPLAVTAYNHGRGGMSKAARELKTSQLGNIINNYKSPSFGFASKNFYAEFLAAAKTYDLITRTGLVRKSKPAIPVANVTLTRNMSLREISNITSLSIQDIAKMNLCLTSLATNSRADSALPLQYEIRLPKKESALIKRSIASSGFNKSSSRYSKR